MNPHPPQVSQGGSLWIEVFSNRSITVTGTLDARLLTFAAGPGRMWALAGVPVGAELGSRPVELSIDDGQGARVSTSVPLTVVAADFGTETISVPPARQSLLDGDVIRAETDRVFGCLTHQQSWLGLFVWPHQGEITSPYGTSRTYDGSRSGYHLGIDISGDLGAPVVADNSGRFAQADG